MRLAHSPMVMKATKSARNATRKLKGIELRPLSCGFVFAGLVVLEEVSAGAVAVELTVWRAMVVAVAHVESAGQEEELGRVVAQKTSMGTGNGIGVSLGIVCGEAILNVPAVSDIDARNKHLQCRSRAVTTLGCRVGH